MLTRRIDAVPLCLLVAIALTACGARTVPGGSRRGDGGAPARPDRGVPVGDFTVDFFFGLDRSVPAPDIAVGPQRACINPADFQKLSNDALRDKVESQAGSCGLSCLGNPDLDCARDCIRKQTGLSVPCAGCWADTVSCWFQRCLAQCAADPSSPACDKCRDLNCRPALAVCSGLP